MKAIDSKCSWNLWNLGILEPWNIPCKGEGGQARGGLDRVRGRGWGSNDSLLQNDEAQCVIVF